MKNRTSFAYKIMIGVGTLWLLLSLLGCATASSDNLTDINELESISAEHNSIISEAKYRDFLKKTLSSKGYSEKDFNDNAETLLLKHYPEVLLVDSKIKSYRDIYTLDNEIPAGLILYNISYENLKSTKSDYVKDEDHVLRYGPYSLYGYSCDIEFRFNDDDILDRIYVWGQYERDVITFTKSDIERIGTEIEEKLNVKPTIGHHEGTQYTFVKDGIKYKMDTYAHRTRGHSCNTFCLKIQDKNIIL